MKRITILIIGILMVMPMAVSAQETLTTTDVSVQIFSIGSHYDLNFDISPGTDIGGIMDIRDDGTCAMILMTYEQYLPFENESIIGSGDLEPTDYSFWVQKDYNQGPIEWNYTVETTSNWFVMFLKIGGSNSKMNVNASIWDWEYVITETYPTATTINTTYPINNETTSPTITYPTTINTIDTGGVMDPYIIGLLMIGAAGLFGIYYVTNPKRIRWG